jgi:XTP/dITP diphosphohydrolase
MSFVHVPMRYPEIQSDTLEEVARFGVDWLVSHTLLPPDPDENGFSPDRPFILDDSGLFVDALGGFPGVYSAYVHRTLGYEAILTLLSDLRSPAHRGAVFSTVIGLHTKEAGTTLFRGDCRGTIAADADGSGGFGYDPIFVPEGSSCTFARMDMSQKDRVSHRGKAFRMLFEHLLAL